MSREQEFHDSIVVPDGYRKVAFRRAKRGESYLWTSYRQPVQFWDNPDETYCKVWIVEPIPQHELDRQHQLALIAAANLLCDEVRRNMPPGWTVTLTMDGEEASLSLEDPEGNDVGESFGDINYSSITAACDWAKDSEAAAAKEGE